MQREHEEEQRRKEEEERLQQQSQLQASSQSYRDHLAATTPDAFSWDSYKKRGAGMFGALKDTAVGLATLGYWTSGVGMLHMSYNITTDPQGELEKMQALSDGISDGINGLIVDPMKIVRALDRMSMDPEGQGQLGAELFLFLLPAPKGLSLMKGGRVAARGEAAVANNLDEVGKVASKLNDVHVPSSGVFRSGEMVGGERAFAGGLDAARDQFDPLLQKMFRESGVGEFQGIWLNRMKSTQFDDIDLAIYFQRNAHVTGRVLGEEVQHAIDFTMGATRQRVLGKALKHVPEAQAVDWWHRRVFTRLLQNANQGNHGLGAVSGHIDDIYRRYQSVGGKLSLDEILTRKFNGLY